MKTKFDFEVKNGEKRISAVHLTAEEDNDFDFLLAFSAVLKLKPDALFEFIATTINENQ